MHIENTGRSAMEFQALLHTYHRVPMAIATITPLKGLTYTNKTKPGAPKEIEEREAIDAHNFTDFVYEKAGGNYEIAWDGIGSIDIRSMGFKDVVVWNPGKDAGAKMADMEDNGWYDNLSQTLQESELRICFRDHFICLEPGYVSDFVELAPGVTWKGQQVLTVL
jgi:glucose-6-phosphate 1-epimerase